MQKSILKSIVMASALALSVGMASATTITLEYEGATANGGVKINPVAGLVNSPTAAGAYGFRMDDVTPGGDVLGKFIAWCLDLEHYLQTSGTQNYMITSTPFTNSYGLSVDETKRVQSVFDANFAGVDVGNDTQAAGFQVALWNALYDGDLFAGSGIFSIQSEGTGAGIITQANAYLAAAAGYTGQRAWNLIFLESNEQSEGAGQYQNLVTVSAVPLPAAATLLLLALGGLGAVGRRRRAA